MRLAATLLLLTLAGAAQAADWPQGTWCEVQRQNRDGASPVTVEYRLGADGALSRCEDGRVRSGRWQLAPEGLELDGETLSAIRRERSGFTAHGASEDRLFLASVGIRTVLVHGGGPEIRSPWAGRSGGGGAPGPGSRRAAR
jgi:hypothetical protein